MLLPFSSETTCDSSHHKAYPVSEWPLQTLKGNLPFEYSRRTKRHRHTAPHICGSEEEKVNEIGCSSLSTLLSWHYHDIIMTLSWHHLVTPPWHIVIPFCHEPAYMKLPHLFSLRHLFTGDVPLVSASSSSETDQGLLSFLFLFVHFGSVNWDSPVHQLLFSCHQTSCDISIQPLEIVFLTVTNVLNSACGVRLTFPTIASSCCAGLLTLDLVHSSCWESKEEVRGAGNLCRVCSVLTGCGFSQGLDSLWHHHNESDVLSLPVAATGSWLVEGSILVPNI